MVEVVDDHTNEEVECEEGSKYDEDHKVDIHVDVDFIVWLVFNLRQRANNYFLETTVFVSKYTPDSKTLVINHYSESYKDNQNMESNAPTPLESTAAYIMSIQPLNVAFQKRYNVNDMSKKLLK